MYNIVWCSTAPDRLYICGTLLITGKVYCVIAGDKNTICIDIIRNNYTWQLDITNYYQ